MRLQAGYIYLFKYFNYKRDRQPLVLVLYHGTHEKTGNEIIHGININYLGNNLTEDLIDMLVQIATKQLDAKNMYRFYHSYMKKKLHPVIAKAYRVYLVRYLGNPTPISKGYHETRSFLMSLISFRKDDAAKIRTQLRKEINLGKEMPDEIMEFGGTIIKKKQPSVKEILMSVDDYLNQIKKHTMGDKIDMKKYTGLYRRKR